MATITIRRGVRAERIARYVVTYVLLTLGGLFVSLPFYWLLRTSLMVEGDHFLWPPIIWPSSPVWRNYIDIFKIPYIPMWLFIRNSVLIVVASVVGEMLATSLVSYSFGRLRCIRNRP